MKSPVRSVLLAADSAADSINLKFLSPQDKGLEKIAL
jgi:hypothetical protein